MIARGSSYVRTPVNSPHNKDGSINYVAQRQLFGFLRTYGISDFFLCSTTGEVEVQHDKDRKEQIELIPDQKKENETWIVGTGHPTPSMSRSLGVYALGHGANAAIVVTPDFWHGCDSYNFEEYFNEALDVGGPVYMYDNPKKNGLTVGFVEKMANRFQNLKGVKSGNLRLLIDCQDRLGKEFEASCGDDRFILAAASENLPVTAGWSNCFPKAVGYIVTQASDENSKAAIVQDALCDLIGDTMGSPEQFGGKAPHPVALQKAAFQFIPGMAQEIEMGAPHAYDPVPEGSLGYLRERIEKFLGVVEEAII